MSEASNAVKVDDGSSAAEALTNLTAHRLPALSQPEYEEIDHPAHYGGQDNTYEAIKVIEAWNLGFNIGSTVKYLARAGRKPGAAYAADLRKAAFYLQREIEACER
jgi:hypothetical protein